MANLTRRGKPRLIDIYTKYYLGTERILRKYEVIGGLVYQRIMIHHPQKIPIKSKRIIAQICLGSSNWVFPQQKSLNS